MLAIKILLTTIFLIIKYENFPIPKHESLPRKVQENIIHRHTSIAMQPPCPILGCIAWTESPSKVTRPLPHLIIGTRSYMSRRRIISSSVATNKSMTLSHQPPNILSNLSFLPAKISHQDVRRSVIVSSFSLMKRYRDKSLIFLILTIRPTYL